VWLIEKFDVRRVTLRFPPEEGPPNLFHQIFFDEVKFANAAELTSWDAGMFPTLVCEVCGHEPDGRGNRLTVRQSGSFVIFVPAFHQMSIDEWSSYEYAPPRYVARGIPILPAAMYATVADGVPDLPQINRMRLLTGY